MPETTKLEAFKTLKEFIAISIDRSGVLNEEIPGVGTAHPPFGKLQEIATHLITDAKVHGAYLAFLETCPDEELEEFTRLASRISVLRRTGEISEHSPETSQTDGSEGENSESEQGRERMAILDKGSVVGYAEKVSPVSYDPKEKHEIEHTVFLDQNCEFCKEEDKNLTTISK